MPLVLVRSGAEIHRDPHDPAGLFCGAAYLGFGPVSQGRKSFFTTLGRRRDRCRFDRSKTPYLQGHFGPGHRRIHHVRRRQRQHRDKSASNSAINARSIFRSALNPKGSNTVPRRPLSRANRRNSRPIPRTERALDRPPCVVFSRQERRRQMVGQRNVPIKLGPRFFGGRGQKPRHFVFVLVGQQLVVAARDRRLQARVLDALKRLASISRQAPDPDTRSDARRGS